VGWWISENENDVIAKIILNHLVLIFLHLKAFNVDSLAF